jgi:hypothetical protein
MNHYLMYLIQAINCRIYHCDVNARIIVTACHRPFAAVHSSRRPSLSITRFVVWLFSESTQLSDVVIGPGQATVGGGLTAATHTTQHNTPAATILMKAAVKLVDL